MRLWETAAFIAAFLVCFWIAIARGEEMTADQWFTLTVELQGQSSYLNDEERDFVKNMINVLALSEDRMPKAHQQKWLLSIRDRLVEKNHVDLSLPALRH